MELTVTTFVLLDDHCGALPEETDAVRVVCDPFVRVSAVELSVILGFNTITSQVLDIYFY